MAKQKIADLPQEEQDKIINEMKELGIGGVYATYTVEKAKAAIEKKKAEKENKPEIEGDGANVTPDNPDETKEDDGTTEESSETENQGETSNPENPDNSKKADESKKEDKPAKKAAEPKDEKKADGICHICRSKVYDGVCSGCGFTLRR